MTVRYRNVRHDKVVTLSQPTDAVEANPNMVRLDDRPAESALKAVWVAYAEAVGVDPGGLTKRQIIDAC